MSSNNKKTSSNSIKNSHRRDFIKSSITGAGFLFSNPAKLFFASLFTNMLEQAHAQSMGVSNDFRFLNIMMWGGVPRWIWDLPLRPTTTAPYVHNPLVGTTLNTSMNPVYQTISDPVFNGIRMPLLWSSSIPTANGGSVPMTELAENLLMMRGVNFLIDSHEVCPKLQLAPENGASLTGLVADKASTPIPAISYVNPTAYNSPKGIANINTEGGDPLGAALSSFTGAGSILEISNNQIGNAIDNLLGLMSTQSESKHEYLPSTYAAKMNAKTLMQTNFGNLQQAFSGLHTKYTTLIRRSFAENSLFIPDLEDQVLPGSSSDPRFCLTSNANYTGSDFNSIFNNNTTIVNLAGSFAVAEFMLVNNLSSSINVVPTHIAGLQVGNNNNYEITTDMHDVGSIAHLIVMTKYFRAMSACLYELRDKLKSVSVGGGKNLFDKTAIALASDFNRCPRVDQSGSDHGFWGSNSSIFSGMIKQCEMVGNITSEPNSTYNGTWGKTAPIAANNNSELVIGNICSTIATMVEIDSPSPNAHSVVSKNPTTGEVTPVLPRGINV